jgi:hypothetical protein
MTPAANDPTLLILNEPNDAPLNDPHDAASQRRVQAKVSSPPTVGPSALPPDRHSAHPGPMERPPVHLDAATTAVSPQARRSLQLLWWIPLSPIVGFLLGSLFLSDSWPLWQVVPLALALATPFVIGAFYAYSAIRHHDRTGWIGLVLHLAMTTIAIVMPISESLAK